MLIFRSESVLKQFKRGYHTMEIIKDAKYFLNIEISE